MPCNDGAVERLAAELDISPVTARLLCIRGLGEFEQARRFLSPSLDDLLDPFALTDMRPAVDRILGAIERRERIAIHGDYDVDGVTSTVILRRALELLGADVTHFIPERLRDGYGLQPASLDRLHADGVRLVISVDCGIRGVEAALHARALGLDLVITDHHEPDTELARPARGVGAANAAIDGNDQRDAVGMQALDRRRLQAVAVAQPLRDEMHDVGAEQF